VGVAKFFLVSLMPLANAIFVRLPMPFLRQLSFLFLSPLNSATNRKQKTMKRCTVCAHPARGGIDRDLQAGVPCRPLAPRRGLSPRFINPLTYFLSP